MELSVVVRSGPGCLCPLSQCGHFTALRGHCLDTCSSAGPVPPPPGASRGPFRGHTHLPASTSPPLTPARPSCPSALAEPPRHGRLAPDSGGGRAAAGTWWVLLITLSPCPGCPETPAVSGHGVTANVFVCIGGTIMCFSSAACEQSWWGLFTFKRWTHRVFLQQARLATGITLYTRG